MLGGHVVMERWKTVVVVVVVMGSGCDGGGLKDRGRDANPNK